MKIAHFAPIAPNRCGLYGTTKDLVKSELSAGLEAGIVDADSSSSGDILVDGRIEGYPKIVDEYFERKTYEWAKDADVMVRHSLIPTTLQNIGKPLVLALHGRPESSFRLNVAGTLVLDTMARRSKDERYRAFLTFWPEYVFVWSTMLPKEKLFYIPAPVDLEYYHPEGPMYEFKEEHFGQPNILIVDIWREDVIPFNVIFAALKFQQKYCKTAKIHIVGLQGRNLKAMVPMLNGIKKAGALGSISGLTKDILLWYRAADMVITPHTIATRTVREPLSCGVPVVAGAGNKYTPYKGNYMDIDDFAKAMNKCWQHYKQDKEAVKQMARRTAEISFNPDIVGKRAKGIFEKL